jgi:hypothetical protein
VVRGQHFGWLHNGKEALDELRHSPGPCDGAGGLIAPTAAFSKDLSFKDFPYLIYCESQGVNTPSISQG